MMTKERRALKKLTTTTWPRRRSGWPRKGALKAGLPPKKKTYLESMKAIEDLIEKSDDND